MKQNQAPGRVLGWMLGKTTWAVALLAGLASLAGCKPEHPTSITFQGKVYERAGMPGEVLGIRMTPYTIGGKNPGSAEVAIGFITMGLDPKAATAKAIEWMGDAAKSIILIQNEGETACRVYLDNNLQPVISHTVMARCGYNNTCGLDLAVELDGAPDQAAARQLCASRANVVSDLRAVLDELR